MHASVSHRGFDSHCALVLATRSSQKQAKSRQEWSSGIFVNLKKKKSSSPSSTSMKRATTYPQERRELSQSSMPEALYKLRYQESTQPRHYSMLSNNKNRIDKVEEHAIVVMTWENERLGRLIGGRIGNIPFITMDDVLSFDRFHVSVDFRVIILKHY